MRRAGALVALVAAVALAAYAYLSGMVNSDLGTASTLPPDSQGREGVLRAALSAEGFNGTQAEILVGQARVETAHLESQAFNATLSAWNRHVGTGRTGDWNGRVYVDGTVYASESDALAVDPTLAREHLRCFDSLQQCVRDLKDLLSLSIYSDARAALDMGNAALYAVAIVRGDGKDGFVGPVGTQKAQNYTAALLSQFRSLGVA